MGSSGVPWTSLHIDARFTNILIVTVHPVTLESVYNPTFLMMVSLSLSAKRSFFNNLPLFKCVWIPCFLQMLQCFNTGPACMVLLYGLCCYWCVLCYPPCTWMFVRFLTCFLVITKDMSHHAIMQKSGARFCRICLFPQILKKSFWWNGQSYVKNTLIFCFWRTFQT